MPRCMRQGFLLEVEHWLPTGKDPLRKYSRRLKFLSAEADNECGRPITETLAATYTALP
jgi:hypothetical protein